MECTHLEQGWKIFSFLNRSELRAYGVGYTSTDPCCGKQIGPLGDRPAHKNPAGTHTPCDQSARPRVPLANQVFRTRDEVEPGVRLLCLRSGFMPFLTEFTAPSNVCYRDGSTHLVPGKHECIESRLHRCSIGTVAEQVHHIVAILR